MIDRTAKIEIIQLKDVVIAKRNGIKARAYYCSCDYDTAKTIKRAIDYLTIAEDFKALREFIGWGGTEMSKNHMAEVAALLGVELGEPFKITDDTHDDCQRYHRFTESAGIEISDDGIEWKTAGTVILKFLLMGDARIVKLPWKPRENERYYYPLPSDKDLWGGTTWTDSNYDNIRLNRGLVFKTIEEAVAAAEKILAVVKEER